jgi:hypothetical protein
MTDRQGSFPASREFICLLGGAAAVTGTPSDSAAVSMLFNSPSCA